MKADIICEVCGACLGQLQKKVINAKTIESYIGCFTCDCGGPAILVIVDE
jgi:hypothetical protein